MKALFAPIIALALLASCQPAPILPPEETVDVRFNHLPAIGFTAGELRIASDFVPSFRAPHVEHLFQTTPAEAMAIWAKDRLHVSGNGPAMLDFVILDASITETPLPVKDGLSGMLTTEPSERYDARLVAELKLYDGIQRLPAATAQVNIAFSRSINEDSDVYAREQFFHDLLDDLMTRFNTQMETEIASYFQPYTRILGK